MISRLLVPLFLAASYSAQQAQPSQLGPSSSAGAPEIDVALAGAALALVIGGLFVLTTARRRKLARS